MYDSKATIFFSRENNLLRERRTKPQLKDFEKITQIGQGAYGDIHLVRHIKSKEIFALKTIPKRFAQYPYQRLSTLIERDILATSKHQYLVHLHYAFQDPDNLFLAMDYLPGGDFRSFLNNSQPLDSDSIQFYMAEMVLAVGSLHDLGYIHRDVKPENFLISGSGHIKLADFGLACGSLSSSEVVELQNQFCYEMKIRGNNLWNKNNTFYKNHPGFDGSMVWAKETVGSTDYMAVEVLLNQPYNNTVDFWSLGCVLYEMITGQTPFQGSHEAIINWKSKFENIDYLRYDEFKDFDRVTWDLLTKLITDPHFRLKSSEQILHHPFFPHGHVELNKVLARPPFKPALDSEDDCKYFDDFSSPEVQKLYLEIIMHRKQIEKKIEKKEKQGKHYNLQDGLSDNNINKKYPVFTFKRQRN